MWELKVPSEKLAALKIYFGSHMFIMLSKKGPLCAAHRLQRRLDPLTFSFVAESCFLSRLLPSVLPR